MSCYQWHLEKAQKSQNGTLESRAGFKGLCRKGMMLFYVLIAAKLNLLLGVELCERYGVYRIIVNDWYLLLKMQADGNAYAGGNTESN